MAHRITRRIILEETVEEVPSARAPTCCHCPSLEQYEQQDEPSGVHESGTHALAKCGAMAIVRWQAAS